MTLRSRARVRRAVFLGVLAAGCAALSCGGSSQSSGDDSAGGGAGASTPRGGAGGTQSIPGSGGEPGNAGGSGGEIQGGSTRLSSGGSAGSGGTGTGGALGSGGSVTGGAPGSGGAMVGGSAGFAGSPNVGGMAGVLVGGAAGQPPAAAGAAGFAGAGGGWGWPATLSECDAATDEHLWAVVYDGPKVPEGMYDGDGRTGGLLSWNDSCASDISAARLLAQAELGSWDSEDDSSPYYYEFVSGTAPDERAYRVTKCEFFDGTVLGEPYRNPEGVRLLASYLWFVEYRVNASAKVVAGAFGSSAARFDFALCFTITSYGDWGLSDQITYYERRFSVELSGSVSIDPDESLRTIEGEYHPSL